MTLTALYRLDDLPDEAFKRYCEQPGSHGRFRLTEENIHGYFRRARPNLTDDEIEETIRMFRSARPTVPTDAQWRVGKIVACRDTGWLAVGFGQTYPFRRPIDLDAAWLLASLCVPDDADAADTGRALLAEAVRKMVFDPLDCGDNLLVLADYFEERSLNSEEVTWLRDLRNRGTDVHVNFRCRALAHRVATLHGVGKFAVPYTRFLRLGNPRKKQTTAPVL